MSILRDSRTLLTEKPMTPAELLEKIRFCVERVQFLDGRFGSPVYYATEEILEYIDTLEKEIQDDNH